MDKARTADLSIRAQDEIGRIQWLMLGWPDGLATPLRSSGGMWTERIFVEVFVLILIVSKDRPADAPNTVIQVLIYGISVCVARWKKRRDLERAHRTVPAGLKRPTVVAALPQDWTKRTLQDKEASARCWVFEMQTDKNGNENGYVSVRRTKAMTAKAAGEFMHAHVAAA